VAEEGGISAGGAGRGVMEGSTLFAFGNEPSFDDACELNVDCLEVVVVDVVVGVGDLATLPWVAFSPVLSAAVFEGSCGDGSR